MTAIEGQNRYPVSPLSRRWAGALSSRHGALRNSLELHSRPFRDELNEVEQLDFLLDQIMDAPQGPRAKAAELLKVELTNISHRLAERITRTEMIQRTGTPSQISTCPLAHSVFIV